MKRLFSILFVIFAGLTTLTSCHGVSPDADEEAVLIKKPWNPFEHGGVDSEPVEPGLTWCAFTTDAVYFKTCPVAYNEHIEDAYSNDNTQLDWDIQIKLKIKKGKTPILYKNYGVKWYENNIHKPFVSHFYNLVGNYSPFDLMSNRKVTDSIEAIMANYMNNHIQKLSKEDGEFPVAVDGIYVGKGTPNERMKKEMDRTAAMIQERKSEEQRKKTQEVRESAEYRRAMADKMYMTTMGLTNEQFIQLKAWDIIEKKNGANIDIMVGQAQSMWNIRR